LNQVTFILLGFNLRPYLFEETFLVFSLADKTTDYSWFDVILASDIFVALELDDDFMNDTKLLIYSQITAFSLAIPTRLVCFSVFAIKRIDSVPKKLGD
jgi:hypothetical protein